MVRLTIVPAALILLLTALAYLPATHAGYVWDDDMYVTENPLLHNLTGLARIWFDHHATPQYYPLVHTSYWLEYQLWSLHPAGYHITNIILHAVNAMLIWLVLRRLKVPGGFLAALLFAIHPVHVESVAWITERKNVLSLLFYLLAMLTYIQYLQWNRSNSTASRWYYPAALAFFLAALLSKTVTFTLPAAILIITWWRTGRITRRDLVPLTPMFLLAAMFGMITIYLEQKHVGAEGAEWNLSILDRLLLAGRVVWFYAYKLFWPAKLVFTYPKWHINPAVWWQYLYPSAFFAIIAILWYWRTLLGRGPLACVLFFTGTLLPALGFFNVYPFRFSYVADHFQYHAAIGLITLAAGSLAALVRKLKHHHHAAWIIPAAVIAILALLTFNQTKIYRDAESLWRYTLDRNPNAWMAMTNLGRIHADRGERVEAIELYQRALAIEENSVITHTNLGNALVEHGLPARAIPSYQRAVELRPDYALAWNKLGHTWLKLDQYHEAIVVLNKAVELDPGLPEPWFNLGYAYNRTGQLEQALTCYNQAIARQQNDWQAYFNRGVLLNRLKQYHNAADDFTRSLELKSDLADAYYNRAFSYFALSHYDMARRDIHTAQQLGIKPDKAFLKQLESAGGKQE